MGTYNAWNEQRIVSHVDVTDGCWIFTGPLDRDGYGRIGKELAHRRVYELYVEPISDGLEVDHLCMVRACVNPDHLEPVSHDENMRRRYLTYAECVNGHAYTPENTYIRRSGHRDCRACGRERTRAYLARKREAA